MVVLNRVVTLSLRKFSSKEKAQDIEAFFKDKDVKGFDRGLNQVLQLLPRLICAEY
jgi:aminopeptidase N